MYLQEKLEHLETILGNNRSISQDIKPAIRLKPVGGPRVSFSVLCKQRNLQHYQINPYCLPASKWQYDGEHKYLWLAVTIHCSIPNRRRGI